MAWLSRRSVGIAAGLMLAAGMGAIATRDDATLASDSVTIDFRTEAVTTTNAVSAAGASIPTSRASAPPAIVPAAIDADLGAVRRGAVVGNGEFGRATQQDVSSAVAAVGGATIASPATLRGLAGRTERALVELAPPPAPIPPPASAASGRAVAERQASRADSAEAQRTIAQAPALAAQASAAKTIATSPVDSIRRRQIGEGALRLSEVVVTGVSEPAAVSAGGFAVGRAVPGPVGGSCFALDVNPGADTLGIPLIPRKMQIQLADGPSMGESRLQRREAMPAAANLQGTAAGSNARRAPASATSLGAASAVVQPADALSWTHFSADSVIARWPTSSDVIVFRLGIFGDQVRGSAAGEASVAPPATVTGRKVACGGG